MSGTDAFTITRALSIAANNCKSGLAVPVHDSDCRLHEGFVCRGWQEKSLERRGNREWIGIARSRRRSDALGEHLGLGVVGEAEAAAGSSFSLRPIALPVAVASVRHATAVSDAEARAAAEAGSRLPIELAANARSHRAEEGAEAEAHQTPARPGQGELLELLVGDELGEVAAVLGELVVAGGEGPLDLLVVDPDFASR